jgi:C-terminal processing protease CtpA/Prc
LARVVQIEKRGKIIGDVSSGALMTSITVWLFGRISSLSDYASTYTAMSVTIGDEIMKDGSRIEGLGVIPEEAIRSGGLRPGAQDRPGAGFRGGQVERENHSRTGRTILFHHR